MKRALKPEYLAGPRGEKRAVVLPLGAFEQLMEDYRDLQVVAARKNNPKVLAHTLIQRLRKHGRL